MDFGVFAFIAGMLAFGYMGNPFMAIAFGVMTVVFYVASKESQHKHMRVAGVWVGVVAAAMSVGLTFYSNYLSVLAQQQQAAQYQQMYDQMYGTGDDDDGYVVEPGDVDAGADAEAAEQN